jgi:hypothetical protein
VKKSMLRTFETPKKNSGLRATLTPVSPSELVERPVQDRR